MESKLSEFRAEADRQARAQEAVQYRQGIWCTLWHRKWTLLLSLALCLELGGLYCLLAKPVYTSTAKLYVDPAGLKADMRVAGLLRNSLQNQCELIRSTAVLKAAMERCEGAQLLTFAGKGDKLTVLKQALEVKAGKKDDIISVSLDSPYPAEANLLVASIVESYISNQATSPSSAAETIKHLEAEKQKRAGELAAAFKAVGDFKQANNVISTDGTRDSAAVRRLNELSSLLVTAEMDAIVAGAECEAAKSMMQDPVWLRALAWQNARIDTEQAAAQEQLAVTISQLQVQLAALRQQGTEEHPSVQSVKAQIEQAKRRQAELAGSWAESYLAACRQKLAMANQRKQELVASLAEQTDLAERLDADVARLTLLEAEFKRCVRLNDLLESRINEVMLASQSGSVMVRLIEEADTGPGPSAPNRAQAAVASTGAGVALGVLLAVLGNLRDRRVRFARDISELLDLPLLGAVPAMGAASALLRAQVVAQDSSSAVAEAYRDIRTSVCLGRRNKPFKTILVTSAQADEGKSTFVSNLGIALAQARRRTVLIDADLRNPSLHELFGMSEPDTGLKSLLEGSCKLESAVCKSGLELLDLLPCDGRAEYPSELLHSSRLGKLLEQLSANYDFVLIDSPPVLPVTDARIIGASCDAAIMVVRAERTSYEAVRAAVDDLLNVGASLLGTVLNAVPRRTDRYGRYSQYGYRSSKHKAGSSR